MAESSAENCVSEGEVPKEFYAVWKVLVGPVALDMCVDTIEKGRKPNSIAGLALETEQRLKQRQT